MINMDPIWIYVVDFGLDSCYGTTIEVVQSKIFADIETAVAVAMDYPEANRPHVFQLDLRNKSRGVKPIDVAEVYAELMA